jgi:trehalose-6-phosphate synthase
MDSAIYTALTMAEDDRRGRMADLRRAVSRYDVREWGRAIGADLGMKGSSGGGDKPAAA